MHIIEVTEAKVCEKDVMEQGTNTSKVKCWATGFLQGNGHPEFYVKMDDFTFSSTQSWFQYQQATSSSSSI